MTAEAALNHQTHLKAQDLQEGDACRCLKLPWCWLLKVQLHDPTLTQWDPVGSSGCCDQGQIKRLQLRASTSSIFLWLLLGSGPDQSSPAQLHQLIRLQARAESCESLKKKTKRASESSHEKLL